MTQTLKKIIILIIIVGVSYGAYTMFFKKTDDSNTLISGASGLSGKRSISDTEVLGNQITQALVQIESLNLDTGIFESAIFKSLMDKSEKIKPQPIGRRNPFAPLSDFSVNYDTATSTDETDNLNISTTTESNLDNS